MVDLLEKMDEYFKNTPKEKVQEDWKKSEKYDKVGITVNEFMKDLKKDKATFMQEYLTRNMKSKEEIEQLVRKCGTRYNGYFGYINGYTQCQEDMAKDQTITRFEVIDENGRAYTTKDCKIELSYQDDGRTLKVFIKSLNKQD